MPQQLLSINGRGFQYYQNEATPDKEDTYGHDVVTFENATDDYATVQGVMPVEYGGGSIIVRLYWASWTTTMGAVRWQVEVERLEEDGTSTLTIGFGTPQAVDNTVAAALGDISEAVISFSPAEFQNVAAGDLYRLRITRLGAHANDTMVGTAVLFALTVNET